jgi:hypothetical protein
MSGIFKDMSSGDVIKIVDVVGSYDMGKSCEDVIETVKLDDVIATSDDVIGSVMLDDVILSVAIASKSKDLLGITDLGTVGEVCDDIITKSGIAVLFVFATAVFAVGKFWVEIVLVLDGIATPM